MLFGLDHTLLMDTQNGYELFDDGNLSFELDKFQNAHSRGSGLPTNSRACGIQLLEPNSGLAGVQLPAPRENKRGTDAGSAPMPAKLSSPSIFEGSSSFSVRGKVAIKL